MTRKTIMKLPKSFLGEVQPRTNAAILLLLKLQCPARILQMQCYTLMENCKDISNETKTALSAAPINRDPGISMTETYL